MTEERWQEHFASLLKAEVADAEQDTHTEPAAEQVVKEPYEPNIEQTRISVSKLAGFKGLGPDGIPNELLRRAGFPMVALLHEMCKAVCATRVVPATLKGGRLQEIWKRKGCAAECKNYRGILVADGISKVVTGMMQQHINPLYAKTVPKMQCGAVAQRGTDFAHHLAASYVAKTQLQNRCLFMLFLDLEKAFDFVVREYVMGLPQDFKGCPMAHLTGLGLPADEARRLVQEMEQDGDLLKRIGVHATICELVKALHSKAWARVGSLTSVLCTTRGGRQGCKLGVMFF